MSAVLPNEPNDETMSAVSMDEEPQFDYFPERNTVTNRCLSVSTIVGTIVIVLLLILLVACGITFVTVVNSNFPDVIQAYQKERLKIVQERVLSGSSKLRNLAATTARAINLGLVTSMRDLQKIIDMQWLGSRAGEGGNIIVVHNYFLEGQGIDPLMIGVGGVYTSLSTADSFAAIKPFLGPSYVAPDFSDGAATHVYLNYTGCEYFDTSKNQTPACQVTPLVMGYTANATQFFSMPRPRTPLENSVRRFPAQFGFEKEVIFQNLAKSGDRSAYRPEIYKWDSVSISPVYYTAIAFAMKVQIPVYGDYGMLAAEMSQAQWNVFANMSLLDTEINFLIDWDSQMLMDMTGHIGGITYSRNMARNSTSKEPISKIHMMYGIFNKTERAAGPRWDETFLGDQKDAVAAVNAIRQQYAKSGRLSGSIRPQILSAKGGSLLVAFSTWSPDDKRTWLIVQTVRKEVIYNKMYNSLFTGLGVLAAIGSVIGFLIVLLLWVVLRPFDNIREQMATLVTLDRDKIMGKKPRASSITEIRMMQRSFHQMQNGVMAFSRYLAPAVVQLAMHKANWHGLKMHKMKVTVFFSDVASFTKISEALMETDLLALMSDYLSEMSGCVLKCQGTIDKFIGDAVMALFGATQKMPIRESAIRGVCAALHCRERLDIKRGVWMAEEYWVHNQGSLPATFDCRIGLNSGRALIGNFGCEQKYDFTAIGDVVNSASRLEGINKYYHTKVCISDEVLFSSGLAFGKDVPQSPSASPRTTLAEAGLSSSNNPPSPTGTSLSIGRFSAANGSREEWDMPSSPFVTRVLARVTVVGKEIPLVIHEVCGIKAPIEHQQLDIPDLPVIKAEVAKKCDLYNQAMNEFMNLRFPRAQEKLAGFAKMFPDDKTCLDRLEKVTELVKLGGEPVLRQTIDGMTDK